jgi:hypothetical protein
VKFYDFEFHLAPVASKEKNEKSACNHMAIKFRFNTWGVGSEKKNFKTTWKATKITNSVNSLINGPFKTI